jgi:hypothetical protein
MSTNFREQAPGPVAEPGGRGASCPPGAYANKYGAPSTPSTPRTAPLVGEYVWRCWRAGRTKKGCRLHTAAKIEGMNKKKINVDVEKNVTVVPQQTFHAPLGQNPGSATAPDPHSKRSGGKAGDGMEWEGWSIPK